MSPPRLQSMLSQPVIQNNFIAMQSANISIATASVSVTFTNIPSTQRVTYKIYNSGSKDVYVCGSNSNNLIIAAVASTSTPQPTSNLISVSTCDCVAKGSIQVLDYVGGTNTLSFICGSGNSTTAEISIGGGQ